MTRVDSIPSTPTELGLRYEKWRVFQKIALEKIIESFDNGKKYFLLNAPTGVGKSLIAVAACKLLGRGYITTHTKILQDQYVSSFDVATIKGRNNYKCRYIPKNTCEDCIKPILKSCPFSDLCPYMIDRTRAILHNITIMNNYYFTIVMNYTDKFDNRPLLVVDEAHLLENDLMSFVEINISKNVVKKYIGDIWTDVNDFEEALEFLNTLYHESSLKYSLVIEMAKECLEYEDYDEAKELMKQSRLYEKLMRKIETILENKDIGWVVNKVKTKRTEKLLLKPLHIHPFTDLVFEHTDHVLLMSATLSKNYMKIYGIDEDDAEYLELPSPFPRQNRPLYIIPKYELSKTNLDKDYVMNWVVKCISLILSRHKFERGIIHTSSTNLAKKIYDRLRAKFDRLYLIDSDNKDMVMEYLKQKDNSVLIGANLHTGLDFRDDLARFQIIVNLPYPSLEDPQVRARAKVDRDWYLTKMAERLIQSYGRAVRHERDRAVCYVLDKRLIKLINYNGEHFPVWFKEAVHLLKYDKLEEMENKEMEVVL